MNGVSLLLVLSSLGTTTSVEAGTNGQPMYTIRIESLLVNELRSGQTVEVLVAPRDRRIRHFKIAITPDGSARTAISRASDLTARAGDLFDYEATQRENGEIEYVIQISPERLESLAAGKPIEGDIAPEIVEVHRYLIFVGVGQLPSQQQAAALATTSPSLLTGNNGLVPAGAEVRATSDPQSRNNTTPLPKNPFQPAAQPTAQRGFQQNDPLTQFNTRTSDPRANWRNQPDQSVVNPPPFANSGLPANSASTAFPRSPGLPATPDRNTYLNQPNYGTGTPAYNNQYLPNGYGDPNTGYAQTNPALYPQQGYANNPAGGYQQPLPGYQQPATTIAARNDLPPAGSTTAPQSSIGWSQPVANNSQPAAGQPAATATTAPATQSAATLASSKDRVETERPWTPLILTTLALFASLGSNAYLGWLAWSFFWRFRDAVTESARTRAQHSMSRQAA